ncbi:MAG: metallophosphoesterase [Blastocatellia bacterium]|nr:metallophosphoesterase [Blastocatellia bacterium]
MPPPFYFGAIGDVHGRMFRMVELLSATEQRLRRKLEFVLQVGDFEPHRDEADLHTMAAPSKYRRLGDFPEFYNGKATFPWPVYFIGGNHEPYGYLDRFPAGAELIHNCQYLGRSGCLTVNSLNVVGLSGIYHADWYSQPRPEISRIASVSNKSFMYFNESDVDPLLNREGRVDILLLHEWPANIIDEADQAEFEQVRRSLRYDSVGNEISELVVQWLKPKLVLCGHMHKQYRRRLVLSDNQSVSVCCLASVHEGTDSIAVFQVNEPGEIIEVCFNSDI